MVDINNLTYKLLLVTEKGEKINITASCDELSWEEGENEISARISIGLASVKYKTTNLRALAKPQCVLIISAIYGSKETEVVRGIIIENSKFSSNTQNGIDILAYDNLFYLMQSQDNRYISAGTGTKSALLSLFSAWNIPIAQYNGPNVKHAKTLYKNEYISDIILDLLDDANKKGAKKCIVRATKNAVSIVPEGGNSTIYHFEESNSTLAKDRFSTQDMITRVKVVGVEDSEGRQPVEAVVNGKTEYGIRQRIYSRDQDTSLSEAKSAAQEILKENGAPERSISLESLDVPFIRKGDKVHVATGLLNGYFIVKSVQHDAKKKSMTMSLKTA